MAEGSVGGPLAYRLTVTGCSGAFASCAQPAAVSHVATSRVPRSDAAAGVTQMVAVQRLRPEAPAMVAVYVVVCAGAAPVALVGGTAPMPLSIDADEACREASASVAVWPGRMDAGFAASAHWGESDLTVALAQTRATAALGVDAHENGPGSTQIDGPSKCAGWSTARIARATD
jgi:hypothetical protein